jgi:hypothetical protein
MSDFKTKFYSAIKEAEVSPEEAKQEFKKDDPRWGETKMGEDSPTGKSQIYINHDRFKRFNAGPNYRKEMLIGEGIHLLKELDPERAEQLYQSAINDPAVLKWLQKSYKTEAERGEKRPFDKWVKHSRLDQIIGGYLLGNKKSSIPTMRDWPTERLVYDGYYGTQFKAELEKLKKDLDL